MFDGLRLEPRIAPSVPTGCFVASNPKLPVLIVLHQKHSHPGHVGHWFRRNGYTLDIRRHFDGAPLPQTLSGHCGAVIFGGPQSANDSADFIRREIDWIGVALKEQKPFLGICLGAQMLASHLGARVDHCRQGTVEIGYHDIHSTQAGAGWDLPARVFQWHREGFDLPSRSVLLASSTSSYPNQAFQFSTALGVQFHPEITLHHILRWTSGNPLRLLMRGARPRQQQIDDHLIEARRVRGWLDGFLSKWVAIGNSDSE
jgi:GMP synthase (glutamine-hydrolysing)